MTPFYTRPHLTVKNDHTNTVQTNPRRPLPKSTQAFYWYVTYFLNPFFFTHLWNIFTATTKFSRIK